MSQMDTFNPDIDTTKIIRKKEKETPQIKTYQSKDFSQQNRSDRDHQSLGPDLSKKEASLNDENVYNLSSKTKNKKQITKNHTHNLIHQNKLTISLWNCRSLNSTLKTSLVKNLGSDIVILTEIWNPSEEIQNKFKKAVFSIRSESRGGGVAVLGFSSDIEFQKFSTSEEDMCLVKVISQSNNPIWVLACYFQPPYQSDCCNKCLDILEKYIPSREWNRTIIIGDFNLDMNKKSKTFRKFNEKLIQKA